jgi:membrane-associated phospholipid phosphatase
MRRAWPGLGVCLSMLAWLGGVDPAWAQEPTPAPPLIPGPPAHVQHDDKRRTLRSYGYNLAHNFVSVVRRDNYEPLLITATLTGASFTLDNDLEDYFQNHPHDNLASIGAALGSSVAVAGLTIGVFSAGRISRGDRFRAASYDLSQAILLTQAYTVALKVAVRRERPDGSNNRSFPSGHASNAFAIASVTARHYKKLAIPAYAFGTYVAVSRMAAEKHHFSDIVAGSGLGLAVGRVVVRRNGRPPGTKPGEPLPDKTTWEVMPWAGPSGDGRGLALVVTF